ncbi:MAG: glycosyltransferase, partial [Spirulinaceae cyanobacterium]
LSCSDLHLGIVCPMANEEENAASLVVEVLDQCKGFKKVSFLIVVDRVSRDGTIEILQEIATIHPEIKVIWAPENRSVVDAYLRGYKEALQAGCDWILEMDAGYSHKPKDMVKFFDTMGLGYDCVFGSRFMRGGEITDFSLFRYGLSRVGGLTSNVLLGTKLSDMTSGFELFSHAALVQILQAGIQSKGHFFQTEIKFHCRKLNITEVPISYSSPSPRVNNRVIKDALKNLFRLTSLRLKNKFTR